MEEKLTYEEFVKKAIVSLRRDNYKGIHTVYSGFNEAFKKYFEGDDPIKITNRLADEGKIVIRPVRGGVMLYLPGEAPADRTKAEDALEKMGIYDPTAKDKLSYEEFVKKAIVSLRRDNYKGIHTVYSGFNEAFKKYFEGDDPIKITNRLADEGKIVIRPVRGGVMLYLPEEAPADRTKAEDALGKMGL